MKKLLFLLMMFPVVLFAQPGNPDANGVVSPGPPWVTGVSEGDGELKAQFGYLSTRIDSLPGPKLNIELFGAIPNDGLSDTAAINAAIRYASSVAVASYGEAQTVYIPYGKWTIDGPIFPMPYVNVECDGAYFFVPSGYTGAFLHFKDGQYETDFNWYGVGTVFESGPQSRLWTGIFFDKQTSSSYYTTFSSVQGLTFYYPNTGVKAAMDGGGWANDILFNRCIFRDFVNGVVSTDGGSNSQFRGNEFVSCLWQATSSTEYGLKDIADGPLKFVACDFWDFDVPSNAKVVTSVSAESVIFDETTRIIPEVDVPFSFLENVDAPIRTARGVISYSPDNVADTVVYIPDLGMCWEVVVRVSTAFNDSGYDYLDIGHGGDLDYWVNNLDVSTTGFKTLSYSVTPPILIYGNNYMTLRYDGQYNDATAGSATVWFKVSSR